LKEGSEEVDFLKKVAELATYTISVTFGCWIDNFPELGPIYLAKFNFILFLKNKVGFINIVYVCALEINISLLLISVK
jgi:hypothetical protein